MTTVIMSSSKQDSVAVKKDVDGGWAWVVLLICFCCFAIMSGLFYTFGIYYTVFIEEFNESRSTTAWIGSLNGAFFQISGPIGSVIIVKFGCRVAVMVGGIICCAGYLLSALSPNVWHLLVSYGFVIAVGHNLVYTGLVVSLGQYFQKRHSLAMGLSMAGSGMGLIILGPAIQYAILELGWRGSMIIDAGLTLQYLVAGALIFPKKDKPLPPVQQVGLMGSQVLTKPIENKAGPIWDPSLLVDAKFWCLNLSSFFWVMGGLTVFVISKDFAESRNLGSSYTLALMGIGIGDIIGRVLGGMLASTKRVNIVCYYCIVMVACSVVILGHMIVTDVTGLVMFSVFFGFSYGQQSVLLPLTPSSLYGSQNMAVIFGFILFTAGFGTLVGPPMAGWIVDETSSYEGAYTFAGICNFVAALCVFLVYVMDKYGRIKNQQQRPSLLLANDYQPTVVVDQNGLLAT